jgi:hypothetical protein
MSKVYQNIPMRTGSNKSSHNTLLFWQIFTEIPGMSEHDFIILVIAKQQIGERM